MNNLVSDFFKNSKIDSSTDAKAIMEFLTQPESINKMIVMAQMNLPSLTAVAEELEKRFALSQNFPLTKESPLGATNRQNVGRMIKYIMREFGYYPVRKNPDERTRLRDFARTQYFTTGAIYEKVAQNPNYTIELNILSKGE